MWECHQKLSTSKHRVEEETTRRPRAEEVETMREGCKFVLIALSRTTQGHKIAISVDYPSLDRSKVR